MLSTRVPSPGAAPRLRRPRLTALGLLLTVLTAAVARAEAPAPPPPLPGDPVAEVRNILTEETVTDLAGRRARMLKAIDGMNLEQLSRLLLLQEWHTLDSAIAPRSDAEKTRKTDNGDARTEAAAQFVKKAEDAMKAAAATTGNLTQTDLLRKAATADLIGETAAAGRKLDYVSLISGGARNTQSVSLADQLKPLTRDLISMTELYDPTFPDGAAAARIAAARALGEIHPADQPEDKGNKPPRVGELEVGALVKLLSDPKVRQTAADAIENIAEAAADERQRSLGLDDVIEFRFFDLSEVIWQAVLDHEMTRDQPVGVRQAGVKAFARITTEMLDITVVPETNAPLPFPFSNEPKDKADAAQARARIEQSQRRLSEVFGLLRDKADRLSAALDDPDPEVRRVALTSMADLAILRQRVGGLVGRTVGAGFIPAPKPAGTEAPGSPAPTGKEPVKPQASRFLPGAAVLLIADNEKTDEEVRLDWQNKMFQALDGTLASPQMLAALGRQLQARDPETRRAALDVMELLGDAAAPAVGALTGALQDQDKFVRWAAARTLGELAKAHALDTESVSTRDAARGVGELLRDQDWKVRLAAATALERFGPAARPAAPILTRSLNRSQTEAALRLVPTRYTEQELVTGDPVIRTAVMRALVAINSQETIDALPEAVIALRDPNVQVRQAAADMIARVGPKATEAYKAVLIRELGKALADPEGEVRRAVSGALLSLTTPK